MSVRPQQMNRKILISIVSVLIIGCARSTNTLQRPQDIPVGWTQKIEERGALPIGRVVAIEQKQEQEIIYDTKKPENESLSFGDFLILPFVPIVLFASDLVGLFVPDKSPDNDAGPDRLDEKSSHEKGIVYRHVIRLIGTDEEVVRDEFFSFKVGDCVALRSTPQQLVMALPGECE